MGKILIVDDDDFIRSSIQEALAGEDYTFFTDNTGNEVFSIISDHSPELILLDVFLGKMNGIDLLKQIKQKKPLLNVVMISGEADIETAISAVRYGAFDFLEKPISMSRLKLIVRNALNDQKQKQEKTGLIDQMLSTYSFIGKSKAISEVEKMIDKAGPSTIPVLFTGENGTGKEIAARRLHYKSDRASMQFLAVNCASIPSELLESELFGHKKGSFTGAVKDKEGFFLKADGGTIFLDEIGDMPIDLQAKLLRVLQEKEVTRIGENEPQKIDVRVISASNKNLLQLIDKGIFRDDLYYRLNGLTINIPPLRERKEDIPDLVDTFIKEFCYENNNPAPAVDNSAIAALNNYSFPGNIRELKNIVQRTVLLCDDNHITGFHLPEKVSVHSDEIGVESLGTLHETKHKLLEQYLKKRLTFLNDDKKALAQELGIHVNNLYRILREVN